MINKTYQVANYLYNHNAALQIGLFLLLFFIGWNIENFLSPSIAKAKWRHAFFNVKFFIADALPQILLGLFFIKIMQWTKYHHLGLIYLLPLKNHAVLLFIIAFVFLDFGEYIYHVIMHKVKCLWLFHVIHHSDNIVDVSTVFREHPMESVIRNCFALLWVFLSGVVPLVFFVHLIVQKFFVLFSHTNIRLFKKPNTFISLIFITPNLHQVHHHYKQPYTDCNYGDILSIWDRIFGTFCILPHEEIIFGIDSFIEKKEQMKFKRLIKYPFKKI